MTKRAFRVYVAGPMTKGDKEENLSRAIAAGEQLMAAGLAPHVPQCTYCWSDNFSHAHEEWMRIDLPWVEAADAVVRLSGESKGADMETAAAEKAGVPVFRGCGNRECVDPECDGGAVVKCVEFFDSYERNLKEARQNMLAPSPEEIRIDTPTGVEIKMAPVVGGTKVSNPKDDMAGSRLPLDLVPDTMSAYAALGFLEGALKYGRYNWRICGVRASVYRAAMQRHIDKWWNGENVDAKTGVPHLASVLASVGIILDAGLCGKLEDDRPPSAPVAALIDDMQADVIRLKGLFAKANESVKA